MSIFGVILPPPPTHPTRRKLHQPPQCYINKTVTDGGGNAEVRNIGFNTTVISHSKVIVKVVIINIIMQ